MRTWKLANGDPLYLTLAADPRLGKTDYGNDVIWELNLGNGEPPALAAQTDFGLRARWMQVFPAFTRAGVTVIDPAEFFRPPQVTRFFPNYLEVQFAPYEGVETQADYWVPESQVLAGRLTLSNKSVLTQGIRLDWSAVLNPLGYGEGMSAETISMATVLQGRTDGISVVCFLSGGPQSSKGPYPGLSLQMELYPGSATTVTWAAAALATPEEAFELARSAASRIWDAELARLELRNTAETVEITTGDTDWDAAFALGQKAAFGLFHADIERLPAPSFTLSRRIDQGASARGDGSDHPYLWSGQTALDSYLLAGLLPGAPHLAEGLLRNFLYVQGEQGYADWRPGLGGQRTHQLAQPLLASLAARSADREFLSVVYPGLVQFLQTWMSGDHDRDLDGLPEWEHPLQTGLESIPIYDRWHAQAQGADIAYLETPALGAMLYHECLSLAEIARLVGESGDLAWPEVQAARLRKAVEACWDRRSALYRYRDAQAHHSPAGKLLLEFNGSGSFTVRRKPLSAQRLVVHLVAGLEGTRTANLTITGKGARDEAISEQFSPYDFTWSQADGRATTRQLFSQILRVETSGLEPGAHGTLCSVDFSQVDCSLFLPLWAGIPDERRTRDLVEKNLFGQFLQPFGIPLCPPGRCPEDPPELSCVAMPWNVLIGEGLLQAGYRQETAGLVTRLMQAVIRSLKQNHGFRQFYHAVTGLGMGERDHLWGLPPLGLFLRAAGFERLSPKEVIVREFNPFPWPVTVKYQRMTITREGDKTTLSLPGRQPVTITGTQAQRISLS